MAGTKDDPWKLTTPPGSSAFKAWREPDADPPALAYRGRFGMYLPPVLEVLGLGEVEHNPRNIRMRAVEP